MTEDAPSTGSRPTIVDVAARAGVSKKTVSRVINKSPLLAEDTRRKVEAVIAELGYAPDPQARALALRRNFLIALVHGKAWPASLLDIQQGMLAALQGTDYALCVHLLDGSARAVLKAFGDFLEYHRPSGVLLAPPLSENDALAGLCWEFGCAQARLGHAPRDDAAGWLWADERKAAARMVNHLVVLGHRRIGFIAGPDGERALQQRELGYLDAMADNGLDRDAALIASGDGTTASGREAGGLLLEISPAPTAILAANDEMAAGAVQAALGAGKAVPQDLSVIGFGDGPLALATQPPLASLHVPLGEMAYAATLRLLDPQAALTAPEYRCELVPRASLAPPAA